MPKLNCWEARKCGREQGGTKTGDLGVCPAATDTSGNGMNGGINGGRICWAISGTLCDGRVQGNYSQKAFSCMHCFVFNQIKEDEGSGDCSLKKSSLVHQSANR